MSTFRKTILILTLIATVAFAGDSATWFDLENCGMCKHLLEDAELFEAMTWNNYVLTNGMMEVTTVPDGYGERFAALGAKMEATGNKLMQGEQLPMCKMCMSFGGLMMAGMDVDRVQTEMGMVTVMTSQDPKIVAAIQKHAKTTIKAYEAMLASQGDGHVH